MGESQSMSDLVSKAVVSQCAILSHHAQRVAAADDVEVVHPAVVLQLVDQQYSRVGRLANLCRGTQSHELVERVRSLLTVSDGGLLDIRLENDIQIRRLN